MMDLGDIDEEFVVKSIKVLSRIIDDCKHYRRVTHALVKKFDVDLIKPCNHGYTAKQFSSMDPVSKISIQSNCELCAGTGFIITTNKKEKK